MRQGPAAAPALPSPARLPLPAPGVLPVAGQRPQLVVREGALQVVLVGMVEHGTNPLPAARHSTDQLGSTRHGSSCSHPATPTPTRTLTPRSPVRSHVQPPCGHNGARRRPREPQGAEAEEGAEAPQQRHGRAAPGRAGRAAPAPAAPQRAPPGRGSAPLPCAAPGPEAAWAEGRVHGCAEIHEGRGSGGWSRSRQLCPAAGREAAGTR